MFREFKHNDTVLSVAFSPDGKTLAGITWKTVKLWSMDGKLLQEFKHNGYVNSVAFSPDGKTLASGSVDNTIKLWSMDGKLLQEFRDNGYVWSVAFSPDGKTLASGSADNSIKLWRTPEFYRQQKIAFLLGLNDKNSSVDRFKNDYLYDYHMPKLVFEYL